MSHDMTDRTLERELSETRKALNSAAYALFQIKRMAPDAIPEHALKAYEAACNVLNDLPTPPPADSSLATPEQAEGEDGARLNSLEKMRASVYASFDNGRVMHWVVVDETKRERKGNVANALRDAIDAARRGEGAK